jgi:Alanine racemase
MAARVGLAPLKNMAVNPSRFFQIEEGIELRDAGISSDILIFSKLDISYLELAVKNNFILNISNLKDFDILKSFSSKNKNSPRFHVKFDTGMTRLGLNINEADRAFKILSHNDELKCEGLYSHFATADEGELSFAHEQAGKFKEILKKAYSFGLEFKTVHFSNSGAVLNLDQNDFDIVRVGMLIYGAFPSNEVPKDIEILPVMEFVAPKVEVRRVEKGTQISKGGVLKRKRSQILV